MVTFEPWKKNVLALQQQKINNRFKCVEKQRQSTFELLRSLFPCLLTNKVNTVIAGCYLEVITV